MEYRAGIEINDGWESLLAETGMESFSDLRRYQNWKTVVLPHNWEDYHGYHRVSHGNLHGTAWYRKKIPYEQEWRGRRVWLLFEGVGSYADVWVNENYAGGHKGGRTCFSLDVTDYLDEKVPNMLWVRARHPEKIRDLPWVCGGCFGTPNTEGSQPLGIFRPVHIQLTGDVRVEPFGVYIAPEKAANGVWNIRIETELLNAGQKEQSGVLRQELLDADGTVKRSVEIPYTLAPGERTCIRQGMKAVEEVSLWSTDSPVLYRMRTCIDGDMVENSFGFREIVWENFEKREERRVDLQKVKEEPSEENGKFVSYSIGGAESDVAILPGGVEVRVDTADEECVQIRWETTLKNNSVIPHSVQLESFLQTFNRTKSIANLVEKAEIAPGETVTITQTCDPLQFPDFWSEENPVLHNVVSTVRGIDEELKIYCQTNTSFGIRPCTGIANKGDAFIEVNHAEPVKKRFLLNGKHVFLNGTCEYEHELGGDHAFSDEMVQTRMEMIRAAGFNALREAHCPHNLRYLEYCEKHGILYWAQMGAHLYFDTDEFRDNFRNLTREWLKERRNSPAVFLWGVQNESMLSAEFTREITEMIHGMDGTSPEQRKVVTCNGGTGSDWNIPQNWSGTYGGSVENYGGEVRRMGLVGEYGQYRVKGKHQEGNMEEQQNSGGDVCEELFTYCLETKVREAERNREYFYGHFQWIFSSHANPGRELLYCLDGLGTNRVGVVNSKGLFTSWGEPTDAYYMYRANYVSAEKEPMVYISSHTWSDRLTAPGRADISVYTNCDEIELSNGARILGRQSSGKKGEHIVFSGAEIRENTVLAKGYCDGVCVAEDTVIFPALPESEGLPKGGEIVCAGTEDLYRVNCGGNSYRDHAGYLWSEDQEYRKGGWGWKSWGMGFQNVEDAIGSFGRSFDCVQNTQEQELLQAFRFGKGMLEYVFPVPSGDYWLELYFAEPWYGCAGEHAGGWRVFDAAVNGETVLSRIDIWREAGGARKAIKKRVAVTAVDGEIRLSFPRAYSNQTMIQAIRIFKR